MSRILIIEDEDGIRRLLRYDLRQFNFMVDSAKDGKEAIDYVDNNEYDVIIVDWMLPVISGIDLVKMFRQEGNNAIILMLTAKDGESDILEAFDAGVDDYMTKPFSPRELTARIKAHLLRLDKKKDNNIIKVQNVEVDVNKYLVKINNTKIDLTKKEFELLVYFFNNLNNVLSRDQILNEVWGFDYDGDTRIVDVFIFNLRKKIKTANVKINSLRGVGYIAET